MRQAYPSGTPDLPGLTEALHAPQELSASISAGPTLSTGTFVRGRYQRLTHNDLKVTTAVVDSSNTSKRMPKLAWFWTIDVESDATKNLQLLDFYRVNWLSAKMAYNRTAEELKILQLEMEVTGRGYKTFTEKWTDRAAATALAGRPGAAYFARRQVAMWMGLGEHAQAKFDKLPPHPQP
ncbi:hypothetical protein OF83DRAFT_1072030 [Amylostereum chailletii]|nr:hypothetical protein OF83DRAFT_1072030 [Amylostereum chailletii]